ncbi:hypothetical protein MUU74_15550 [Chryseobacterium daecheongense]|uniref:hypothetical protein n=1 Tax=Chryseobacterium daecheongense TaxID=192389 RepID=UPI001FD6C8D1|nr:hypothetical protein [Chryseobacterium daecheongense]UOU97898.1 hypothetical protein MUU74_15550 [Chryseobacterium daecheongense]
MKFILIILTLFFGKVLSQRTIPEAYKRIPEVLDNTELLYPFIIPDKKYEYWSVFRNNPDPDKAIIYESQAPEYMTINDPAPEKGFFQQCLGEDCFAYLIACENSRSKYFSNEKQLRDFIGTVDNLPEAILIANTYGYTVDVTNQLGSSYKIENHYILMYLSKVKGNTDIKESFLVKINKKTGKLESKSSRIYQQ